VVNYKNMSHNICHGSFSKSIRDTRMRQEIITMINPEGEIKQCRGRGNEEEEGHRDEEDGGDEEGETAETMQKGTEMLAMSGQRGRMTKRVSTRGRRSRHNMKRQRQSAMTRRSRRRHNMRR
jgi:hypothetical protein